MLNDEDVIVLFEVVVGCFGVLYGVVNNVGIVVEV